MDGRRVGDYPRACDICGHEEWFSKMRYIGQNRWACRDDARGLTAEQISRHNARVKPLTVRSHRHPREMTQVPTYQHAEALVFNRTHATGIALSNSYVDVTSGDGATLPLSGTGADAAGIRPAGEMGRYLGRLVGEGRRSTGWIARAKVNLRSRADTIILLQNGFGTNSSLTVATWTYGAFVHTGSIVLAEDAATCGLALLEAYSALGDSKYLLSAKACAHFLRNLQAGNLLATFFSSSDAAGLARLYVGGWASEANTGTNAMDHRYYVSSTMCLEFLARLLAVGGDGLYGCTGTSAGVFTTAPSQLLSQSIADARAFYVTTGALDATTGTTYTGLSVAKPREFFNAYPAVKYGGAVTGTGSWEFQDGLAGSKLTGWRFAQAIASLYACDGLSQNVQGLYDYVRGFSSNATYETPAGTSTKTLFEGQTGTYDPNLALATLLDTAGAKNGSSLYDWSTAGLLAPIQSVQDPAKLRAVKDLLGIARPRWRENTARDHITDTLIQRTRSGLSYQTSFTETIVGVTGARRVHDTTGMMRLGNVFRYAPQAFGGQG